MSTVTDGMPLDGVLPSQVAHLAARERELTESMRAQVKKFDEALHDACRRAQHERAAHERQCQLREQALIDAAEWRVRYQDAADENERLRERLQTVLVKLHAAEVRLAEAVGATPPALATAAGEG